MRGDGFFVVDKPPGISSFDVVRKVKRHFCLRKAGHIGTLDPFATGVLPIAIHEGTKLIPFIEEEPKEYVATLQLGEETNTDDLTGKVLERKTLEDVTPERVHETFQSFLGRVRQIPPMFSALKVGGKPLYRLARKGMEVERKEKEVTLFQIEIEKMDLPFVHFNVTCSRGTYIRTLARDIGRRLGCGAHLRDLRRVRSGFFRLEKAISWDQLQRLSHLRDLQPWFISLEEALPGLPELVGNERTITKVRFGHGMVIQDLSSEALPIFEKGQWVKITSPEEGLVAILKTEIERTELEEGHPGLIALRPLRVFHPPKPLC